MYTKKYYRMTSLLLSATLLFGSMDLTAIAATIDGTDESKTSTLLEISSAELLAPDHFTANFQDGITLSWKNVENAAGYQIYFAVDRNLEFSKLTDEDYQLAFELKPNQEGIYEANACDVTTTAIDETITTQFYANALSIGEHHSSYNYYPMDSAFCMYKVRAIYEGTGETTYGPFTEGLSSNGFYCQNLDVLNKTRKEAFQLPGNSDYVRFFLGDELGNEYNWKNPITLHVGESLDYLTLWGQCADGSLVNYTQMRDAVIKAEMKNIGFASYYQDPYNTEYAFTWSISDDCYNWDNFLIDDDNYSGSYIQKFLRDYGNTVPDYVGMTALHKTEKPRGLAVCLNNTFSDVSSGWGNDVFPTFTFFVPVNILDAEEGVEYEKYDDGKICESGEEFWATIRKNMHNRKEQFSVLLTQDGYEKFIQENDYYMYYDGTSVWPLDLCDDTVLDDWLWGTYEEKDFFETWAYENLADSMSNYGFHVTPTYINYEQYYVFTFSGTYGTTLEQEQWVDETIKSWLAPDGKLYDVKSKSEYQRAKAAFNIAKEIKWVNGLTSINGRPNRLNYTVYSGLYYKQGSCESSALTLQRLCHELGISCRIIKDDYWGGAGCHAYNIIKVDGLWYYADATNNIFLKGSKNFKKSKELPVYTTERYKAAHPISHADYSAPFTYGIYFDKGSAILPDKTPAVIYDGCMLTGEDGSTDGSDVVSKRVNSYGISMNKDESITLYGNEFILPGYKLTGWKNSKTGKIINNSTISNLSTQDDDQVTLTAQWKLQANRITYNLDGGKLSKKNPASFTYFDDVQIPNSPTKQGEIFLGWAEVPKHALNSSVIEQMAQKPAQSYIIPKGVDYDVTLYAIFVPIKYTIEFDAGFSEKTPYLKDFDASSLSQDAEYNSDLSFANVAKQMEESLPEDYQGKVAITGFSTKPDGKGTKYLLNKSYSKLSKVHDSTITLYAIWSNASHKIIYELNGGVNAKANPPSFTYSTKKVTFKNPSRAGYLFAGWYTSMDSETAITNIVCDQTKDVTVYAKWTPIQYSVKFEKNGAIITDAQKLAELETQFSDLSYDASAIRINESDLPFHKESYLFLGFNTKSNGKGDWYRLQVDSETPYCEFKNISAKKGTVKLYAQWALPTCKIEYQNIVNGKEPIGIKNPNASTYTKNNKRAIALKAASAPGYIFQGWYTSYDSITGTYENKLTAIPQNSSSDLTLYGMWNEINYSLTVDPNDGSYNTKIMYTPSYEESIPLNNYQRSGYILSGWSTKKNGKVQYAAGEILSKLTTKNNGKITLYAIWASVKPAKGEFIGMNLNKNTHELTIQFKDAGTDIYCYEIKTAPTANMRNAVISGQTEQPTYVVENYEKITYFQVRAVKLDSEHKKIYGEWSNAWTIAP